MKESILFKDECYCFSPDFSLWLDVDAFLGHWKNATTWLRAPADRDRELQLAAELYGGDFMEDDLYEEWTIEEREHFKEIYLEVLENLSLSSFTKNDYAEAARLCEEVLHRENCREDIHQRLMICYTLMGHRDRALRQFRKCSAYLRAELQAEPTNETQALFERIRRGSQKGSVAELCEIFNHKIS